MVGACTPQRHRPEAFGPAPAAYSFITSVPLYASNGAGHTVYLGAVVAAGPETSFHFTAQAAPHKLVIDPQMTLLCTTAQTEKTEE